MSRTRYTEISNVADAFDVTVDIDYDQLGMRIHSGQIHPSVCLRILDHTSDAIDKNNIYFFIQATQVCYHFVKRYGTDREIMLDLAKRISNKGYNSANIFNITFNIGLDREHLECLLWKAVCGYKKDGKVVDVLLLDMIIQDCMRCFYLRDKAAARHILLRMRQDDAIRDVAFLELRPRKSSIANGMCTGGPVAIKAILNSDVKAFTEVLRAGNDPCWWNATPYDDTIITTIINNKTCAVQLLALLYTHRSFESLIRHVDKQGLTARQRFRQSVPELTTPEDIVIDNVLTTNTTRAVTFFLSVTRSTNMPRIGTDAVNYICELIVAPSDRGFWNERDECLYPRPAWTPNLIKKSIFGHDLGIEAARASLLSTEDKRISDIADTMIGHVEQGLDVSKLRQEFIAIIDKNFKKTYSKHQEQDIHSARRPRKRAAPK